MAIVEIASGVTSLKNALDLAKAMVGLRDAQAFRTKAIEMQAIILEAYEKAIAAREAQAAQADRMRALEEEMRRMKAWDAEKQRYELKEIGGVGVVVRMLKPAERGTAPAHWVCPNCYERGQISLFQPTPIHGVWACHGCKSSFRDHHAPTWID